MAIQFNCPYCTVTIQVPDAAAGKKGTCPQCGTKVVVPIPKDAPPPQAAAAAPVFAPLPAAPNYAPNFIPTAPPNYAPQPMPAPGYPAPGMPFGFDPNQQMSAPPGYAPPGYAPPGYVPPGYQMPPGFVSAPQYAAPVQQDIPNEPASVTTKKSRKKSNPNGHILWGAFIVIVIIGAVLVFMYLKPGTKSDGISGQLTATRIPKGKLQPSLVRRDWLDGIDEETIANVLKQMEKRTITHRSDVLILKIQGAPEGIKVTATPGPNAELIAIDISSNKTLANWQQKNGNKIGDKHQKDVINAAKSFIKEWTQAEASGQKNFDTGRYHDSLGTGSLTSGLGSEAVALVGKTLHNCVAEQQGLLYFLLPAGTDRFELQGREHGKDVFVLPGRFIVDVESAMPVKKAAPKKTDEEPEMTEEGDNPDMKSKAFGKPALNDPSAVDESMPEKPKAKKKETKNDE